MTTNGTNAEIGRHRSRSTRTAAALSDLCAELPPLSTVAELSEFLSCSPRTVRSLLAAGAIECIRVKRAIRVSRYAVLEFLLNGGTRST